MAKRKKVPPKPRKLRRAPRSQTLPGLESQIKPLEDVAADYADIRDARMLLTKREVKLKAKALRLMHEYGKKVYKRDGIEIVLKPGEEDVKVRVKRNKRKGPKTVEAVGAVLEAQEKAQDEESAVELAEKKE